MTMSRAIHRILLGFAESLSRLNKAAYASNTDSPPTIPTILQTQTVVLDYEPLEYQQAFLTKLGGLFM